MGSILSKKMMSQGKMEEALNKAKDIANSAPVVLFSKTYCGFCQRVKQLLTQVGANFKVVELDEESDGGEIQASLTKWTGLRTVPNVFIGGKHIGGCDTILEKHQRGELLPLLNEAGAISSPNSAQTQPATNSAQL